MDKRVFQGCYVCRNL